MQTIDVKNRDVLVLGLGRSGMAAASLLQRDGAHVVVRDEGETVELTERAHRLRELGVRVELGNHFDAAARFDFAVLSPGIAPARPVVTELRRQKTPVLSELELAYRYCLCPIVAITGTNGKTTTTELINLMLETAGKRTIAAGNIGNALSNAAEQSAGLDALVVETSSFQLEAIEQFRPNIAIWLNLTPDHIDRHGSMEEYARAKARIFMNQTDSAEGAAHYRQRIRRESGFVARRTDDLVPAAGVQRTFAEDGRDEFARVAQRGKHFSDVRGRVGDEAAGGGDSRGVGGVLPAGAPV